MRSEQSNAERRLQRWGQGEARFPPAPRFVIPVIQALLLVALVAVNPVRMNRQTRWSRTAPIGLSGSSS